MSCLVTVRWTFCNSFSRANKRCHRGRSREASLAFFNATEARLRSSAPAVERTTFREPRGRPRRPRVEPFDGLPSRMLLKYQRAVIVLIPYFADASLRIPGVGLPASRAFFNSARSSPRCSADSFLLAIALPSVSLVVGSHTIVTTRGAIQKCWRRQEMRPVSSPNNAATLARVALSDSATGYIGFLPIGSPVACFSGALSLLAKGVNSTSSYKGTRQAKDDDVESGRTLEDVQVKRER